MKRMLLMMVLLTATSAAAQHLLERGLVRRGNRDFERERYEAALERYTAAATAAPGSFEAAFDRAGALYRLERYDRAAEALAPLAADTLRIEADRAEAFYNLGNALLRMQKLPEALEAYKDALRLNPSDAQAKYNYAYVKKLLPDQQNQQDPQNEPKEQEQPEEQEQEPQDDDGQLEQNPGEDPSAGISPEEQERLLDAVQAEEDRTQERRKEREGVLVRGEKYW